MLFSFAHLLILLKSYATCVYSEMLFDPYQTHYPANTHHPPYFLWGFPEIPNPARIFLIWVEVITISGEGNGTPLQFSCLENPMDGGAWWAAVHGVPRSQTRLSTFTFTFHFHALEKEMATHSSVLAWRIPGTGEPGGLPSLGLHRVGHD